MASEIWKGASLNARDKKVHLHFRIAYMTIWGQHLVVSGAGALLGNWDLKHAAPMHCHHENETTLVWEALVTLPWQPEYKYKYLVVKQTEEDLQVEKGEIVERSVVLHEGLQHGDTIVIQDTWTDRSYPGSILNTAAFTKVIKPANTSASHTAQPVQRLRPSSGDVIVRFTVSDSSHFSEKAMFVTGGIPKLGSWQADQMMPLSEVKPGTWEGEVRIPFTGEFTYKYALRTPEGVMIEMGEGRVASLIQTGSSQVSVLVRNDGFFKHDHYWRGAGIAAPVFSLRTENSLGVGDFLDLIPLIDFAAAVDMHLVQLLPVNDTSVYKMWWDSYPYSSLSVFALHPLYLALRALRREMPEDIMQEIQAAVDKLNGAESVDYEASLNTKLRISRQVFDKFGVETLESTEFQAWVQHNSDWLHPYAAFCFLRDLFGTAEHWQWGTLANPTPETIAHILRPDSDYYMSIQFTYYLQYHLHLQLLHVSEYAASQRVVLKGDLPIGVDKRSVDTWVQPNLFRMDKNTGAPPDFFDPNGQNWGFPTYNWEEMSKDNYLWWRRRLSHMSQYFTAYRIDHLLGFFRIWEIPGDCVTGLLGYFRPSEPIWKHELDEANLWDLDRLTQPYVRMHLLNDLFGPKLAQEVAAKYFSEKAGGGLSFRPQYASEKQIMTIEVRKDSPEWLLEETAKIRKGLMKLRQNVLLLRDPESTDKFYPRIGLMQTSSFKDLDAHWRAALTHLHDDYFFGRQDHIWRTNAHKTLPVLMDATDMLVCGEDLGFIPACVPPVMQELGLIGLRIQRMPLEAGQEFNMPSTYPYLTVASPSCHDVSPIRAWFEEDADRGERFLLKTLGGCSSTPGICTPDIVAAIIQQHLNSPSVLAIFPVQDIMALSDKYNTRPAKEEVINDPTNPKHYWRYRMHVNMEELASDEELKSMLRGMVCMAGRSWEG